MVYKNHGRASSVNMIYNSKTLCGGELSFSQLFFPAQSLSFAYQLRVISIFSHNFTKTKDSSIAFLCESRKQSIFPSNSFHQKSTIFRPFSTSPKWNCNRKRHKTQSELIHIYFFSYCFWKCWKIALLQAEIRARMDSQWWRMFLHNKTQSLTTSAIFVWRKSIILTLFPAHFFTQSQIEQSFLPPKKRHSHEPFLISRRRQWGESNLNRFFFSSIVLLVCAFTATIMRKDKKSENSKDEKTLFAPSTPTLWSKEEWEKGRTGAIFNLREKSSCGRFVVSMSRVEDEGKSRNNQTSSFAFFPLIFCDFNEEN